MQAVTPANLKFLLCVCMQILLWVEPLMTSQSCWYKSQSIDQDRRSYDIKVRLTWEFTVSTEHPDLTIFVFSRVSSAWNSMLLDHLSKSTTVSLQYSDLKYWKIIIDPPARETRQAVRARKVNWVTERTRRLIIDFANVPIEPSNRLRNRSGRKTFGLNVNDECPLAAVGRCHPQICHVVLYRFFERYCRPYTELHLSVLGCLSDSMSNLSASVRVTLYEFAFHCGRGTYVFTNAEQTLMKSWKMRWPNVTFGFVLETFNDFLRERSVGYWPYPPDQLTWLNSCLDMIPEGPVEGRPITLFLGYK